MPSWVSRISADTRSALEVALRECASPSQSSLVSEGVERPASRNSGGRTTRQARHAALMRARSTAAAATLLFASRDTSLIDVLLSDDFVWLRPNSCAVHTKAIHIAATCPLGDERGFARLFERGETVLFDLVRRTRAASLVNLLRIHSACCAMFVGCIFHLVALRDAWRELWRGAQRDRRIRDNLNVRMQLAIMGSYVGMPRPHVEWLMDPRMRAHELADTYCFVRSDLLNDVYERAAALIRGDDVDPRTCLYGPNPVSTLKSVADYLLACMRDPNHFSNTSQVLMLMTWVETLHEHVALLRKRRHIDDHAGSLALRLARIERVQHMEQARFWAVHAATRQRAVRDRLARLWMLNGGPPLAGAAKARTARSSDRSAPRPRT